MSEKKVVDLGGTRLPVAPVRQKIEAYVYYDREADRFDTPFWVLNEINARRKFLIDCRDEKSLIAAFPESFTLCRFGTFELTTGEFEYFNPSENVIVTGSQMKENLKTDRKD